MLKYTGSGRLTEESLTRLQQHLDKKEPMAFISAYVNSGPHSINKTRFNDLKHAASSSMFGYNAILGGYTMDNGEFSDEESIIVYAKPKEEDELFEFAKKAGELYGQENVLLVNTQGTAGIYYLQDTEYYHKGNKEFLGELSMSVIEKYFSQIGSKLFSFAKDNVAETAIEENKEFSFNGIGMPVAYAYIINRNKIKRKLGKELIK